MSNKKYASLVPDTMNQSPDYFCTWQIQLFKCNDAGPQGQRDCMTEQSIFGHEKGGGWAYVHPDARRDLIFLMDDCWDVPIGGLKDIAPEYGSQILAPDKFPSFAKEGVSNEQAMKALSDKVKECGWKGLGGWICAQQAPKYIDQDPGEYWKERLQWSDRAGWLYWKIDWGTDIRNYYFRRTLTEMRYKYAPHLFMEQAKINGLIPYSDTFRTYDVFTLMGIPRTLEKLNVDLRYDAEPGYLGIINCMDEVYIGAALGCAYDVTRHNITGPLPDGRPDPAFPTLHRNLKSRIDEVTRAVRWHRIAPAFSTNGKDTQISEERLEDSWLIVDQPSEIEAWWRFKNGDLLQNSAPARFARSLPLPEVKPDQNGDVPYVLCARYPEGAISIGTQGRTRDRKYFTPLSEITLDATAKGCSKLRYDGVFGIFGDFGTLRIKTNLAKEGIRILAQDIMDDHAEDITDQIQILDRELVISGELIRKIGTACAHEGDVSEPGMILQIVNEGENKKSSWMDLT